MKKTITSVGAVVLVAVMAGNAAADIGDPFPDAGFDFFPSDLTHTVQFIEGNPFGLPEGPWPLAASGPTVVERGDPYPGGPDDEYQINTEILSMDLTGTTPFGPFTLSESPTRASIGLIREWAASDEPGHFLAKSFFDVFFEIELEIAPDTFLTIFNKDAAYMYNPYVEDLPPIVPPHPPYVLLGWRDDTPPRGFAGETPGFPLYPLSPLTPLCLYVEGYDDPVGHLVEATHSPTPAPGAALLGAIGLGLVGWVRRRFS